MPRFAPQRRAFLAPVGLMLVLLSPLGGSGCGDLDDGDLLAAADGSRRGALTIYES